MSSRNIYGLSICLTFMSGPALAYAPFSLEYMNYEAGALLSRDSNQLSFKQNAIVDGNTLGLNTDITKNPSAKYNAGLFFGVNYELSEQWSVNAKLAANLNNDNLYILNTDDTVNTFRFDDRIMSSSTYTLALGLNKTFQNSITVGLGPIAGYRRYEIERVGYNAGSIVVGPNNVSKNRAGVGVEGTMKYSINQKWFVNFSYSHMTFDKVSKSLKTNSGTRTSGTGFIDMEPDVDLLTIGVGVKFG